MLKNALAMEDMQKIAGFWHLLCKMEYDLLS